mmetsp:Transcript_86463/g.222711  ORF Transcript_86463/g.222711 Transcript_86463/m.222711 type:complete len:257 (-) Transcript_86463:3044-3814(-)
MVSCSMSMSSSCTTHWMTTSSFWKGSWPSFGALTCTSSSFVGMLSLNSCSALAVTFCHASFLRFLPVSTSSCLKPSTPILATASVSCWMQFSISLRTSSKRKESESTCASKSLTSAVSAARHVGGPMEAAQEAAVPSPLPSGFLFGSPFCSWQWMSSKSGFTTPLKTMRHVSSSKTALPWSRRQSKTPFSEADLTSRLGSLTSMERPRRIGNQCAAGWPDTATSPPAPATPPGKPEGGGGGFGLLSSARYSAACRK